MNVLTNVLKDAKGEALDSIRIYIPFSKKKKQMILDHVQREFNLIVPRIAARTGLDLSPIKIKPFSERLNDLYQHRYKNLDPTALSVAFPFCKCVSILQENFNSMGYEPKENAGDYSAYICFGLKSRALGIFDDAFRTRRAVVHEASHHIWFSIGGERAAKDLNKESSMWYKMWMEGFASYCQTRLFWDLYADEPQSTEYMPDCYQIGCSLVEKVVNEKGEDILFQLPLRWREFASMPEYKNSNA